MPGTALSRRERQIMDIVYRKGRATVAEVLEGLPDPPSYSAVRALMGVLEGKGHLRHVKVDRGYVYLPTEPRHRAARSALAQVVQTFFGGSIEKTVATLLSSSDARLSDGEIERLEALIRAAKTRESDDD